MKLSSWQSEEKSSIKNNHLLFFLSWRERNNLCRKYHILILILFLFYFIYFNNISILNTMSIQKKRNFYFSSFIGKKINFLFFDNCLNSCKKPFIFIIYDNIEFISWSTCMKTDSSLIEKINLPIIRICSKFIIISFWKNCS